MTPPRRDRRYGMPPCRDNLLPIIWMVGNITSMLIGFPTLYSLATKPLTKGFKPRWETRDSAKAWMPRTRRLFGPAIRNSRRAASKTFGIIRSILPFRTRTVLLDVEKVEVGGEGGA